MFDVYTYATYDRRWRAARSARCIIKYSTGNNAPYNIISSRARIHTCGIAQLAKSAEETIARSCTPIYVYRFCTYILQYIILHMKCMPLTRL